MRKRLSAILISIFISVPGWTYRLPQFTKAASSIMPTLDFSSSYKVGTWKEDGILEREVRKIQGTGNNIYYLIEISRKNKDTGYLVIQQKDLMSFLMTLNKLMKHFDDPDSPGDFEDSFFIKSFKFDKGFIANYNEELKSTEIYELSDSHYQCLGSTDMPYYLILGEFDIYAGDDRPQPDIFFEGDKPYPHLLQRFDSKESIEGLSELLRESYLNKNSNVNPDSFERIGKYKGYGDEQLELLRYKKNDISRIYLQLLSTYYENGRHEVYVWMTDSVFINFKDAMKSVLNDYAKKYGKFQKTSDKPFTKEIDDVELSGWIIGEFDVNMNVVNGGRFESPIISVYERILKDGDNTLVVSFHDSNLSSLSWIEFNSPELFDDFVKMLDSVKLN